VRGGAVGSGPKLQAAKSLVRFPMVSSRPQHGARFESVSNRKDYQDYLLGSKGGWCVGLTTYKLHVPIVLKFGSFKLLEPSGSVQELLTNVYVKLRTEFDTVVLYYVILRYVGI